MPAWWKDNMCKFKCLPVSGLWPTFVCLYVQWHHIHNDLAQWQMKLRGGRSTKLSGNWSLSFSRKWIVRGGWTSGVPGQGALTYWWRTGEIQPWTGRSINSSKKLIPWGWWVWNSADRDGRLKWGRQVHTMALLCCWQLIKEITCNKRNNMQQKKWHGVSVLSADRRHCYFADDSSVYVRYVLCLCILSSAK